MRVLVTGSDGYIGHVLVPLLQAAGHDVTGLDSRLYEGCDFPGVPAPQLPTIVKDLRAVEPADLEGFDAVLHLADHAPEYAGRYKVDPARAIFHPVN